MTILTGSHDQVAHAWANKLDDYQKGFNMFRDEDTVYSYGYHFPIARHITLPSGQPAIMLTTRTYSSSTSGHRYKVCAAILPGAQVFHVNIVRCATKRDHKENYKHMKAKRAEYLKLASRARSRKDEYWARAETLGGMMNHYSRTFKLGYRSVVEVGCSGAELL